MTELQHNPALRLFAERALAVQPSFAITERNAHAVAQVCAREAVCTGDGIAPEDVLDVLSRLVSKSLVLAEEAADGAERYRLLETVRQYARERLVASNEAELVHQRHATYFLEFVEAFNPQELLAAASLWTDVGLLDRLERELDNLRAALRWWIELQDAERAVRQADAVLPIWFLRGSLKEGRAWLEELLSLATAVAAPAVRMHALPMLANLARRHGEYGVALDAYQEMLSVSQAATDRLGVALVAQGLSNRQIANPLVITERTVAAHIEHILPSWASHRGHRSAYGWPSVDWSSYRSFEHWPLCR